MTKTSCLMLDAAQVFLANAVAGQVKKVFAADISKGVLECAKILQPAKNVEYIYAGDVRSKINGKSLDLIYSFAVIQHVTDEVYDTILDSCSKLLKDDGKIIFHVELESELWKSEQSAKEDGSIVGKVKLHCGLNCFGRKLSYFYESAAKHGFKVLGMDSIATVSKERFDDVCDGHLLVMSKDPAPGAAELSPSRN